MNTETSRMKGSAPKKAISVHMVLNWFGFRICHTEARQPIRCSTIWNTFTLLNRRDTPKIRVKNSRVIRVRKIRLAARTEC